MAMKVLLALFYILNGIAVVSVIFEEKKKPSATLSWIIALIFLPGVGLIFYLFFGRGFKIGIKKRLKIKEELVKKYNTPKVKEMLNFVFDNHNIYSDPSGFRFNKIINFNFQTAQSLYTHDNKIEIFTSGADKYASLFEDIKNAKHSINVIYYIIENDCSGKEFVNLLTQKASQGVTVRLIFDDIGSFMTPYSMFRHLKKAGGQVKKFSPLLFGSFLYANYRNHRKIVVIDGEIAYSGGMNIGDEYLGKDRRITPWRDTHYKIRGSAAHSFQLIFFMDWYYVTNDEFELAKNLTPENFPLIECGGTTGVQVVPSGPDSSTQSIKKSIVSLIYEAKKTVMIQTPYFIPDSAVLEAIQTASASGVKVSVMMPKIADHIPVHYVSVSFIAPLIEYGADVYMYNGFIHAKTIVIDGQAGSIGTTNFDVRSFGMLFEVNTFIYDEDTAKKMEEIFYADIKNSEKILPELYKNRSRFEKIKERIFRLASPLF